MDKLNIDFNSLLPYVIDAFSSVYGDEYRSIISKKINSAVIVSYHDVEGLDDYIFYLKNCKERELSIHFLEEIGVNIQSTAKKNYTKYFDDDIKNILNCLIDDTFGFSFKNIDYWAPLRAFNKDNNSNPDRLLKNKIKILNYLLENKQVKITEENFQSFTETEEFSKLLKKINEFNMVYEKVLSEYNNWLNKLIPYEKYIEDEKKRKEDILQKKKRELFSDFFDQLPCFVKDSIYKKELNKQQDTILGSRDISHKSIIEYFSYEQIKKLESSNVSLLDKFWIVYWQTEYLRNLGVTIPNEDIIKCNSEEDINNYLSFLNQDDIKKYLPSDELINYILSIREIKYEEALREYYTTRKDFIDVMKMFNSDRPNNIEFIYHMIKNKRVCIAGRGATNEDNEFVSLMFYTIRVSDGGRLSFSFMHENGHIIDQNQKGCGFESFDDFGENFRKNPYDNSLRKYERFNETLNDIFTIEAIKILQDQGIYLLEAEKITSLDPSNYNTSSITKSLLQPLLQKFRRQVIKAKINSEPEELIKYIGENNFEELVDVINKVDYLLRNEVLSKIDNSPEDAMVIEYFEQLERAKQIYINIDNYYVDNFEDLSGIEFEETSKKKY